MKNKSYLVTGGSGFIGSALVRRLIGQNKKVRVLDNNLRGGAGRLKDIEGRIEMVRADVRDPAEVRKCVKGVDGVIHAAYLNGTEFFYKRPDLVLDIGVKGMVNVIDSCIAEKVKELVLLSSSEVYQTPPSIPTDEKVALSVPDPLNPRYSYGGGKIISELMAINYGRRFLRRVVIVRPHNVYGPDMGWEHVIPQFIIRMKESCRLDKKSVIRFPIQGDGSQTRAFVFIDDFVEAFMLILNKGENLGIYNIGTDEEISIKKVAGEVAAYFGRRVRIAPGAAAKGAASRRCSDITKIRRLGYRPKISFSEGLRITADWYVENSGKNRSRITRRAEDEKIRFLSE